MPHKSTNSWPTASLDIGAINGLAAQSTANDNVIWDRSVFSQRLRELGNAGTVSLLQSLLQYCETIAPALTSDLLDEPILEIVRGDLAPISHFLGFSSLCSLLLTVDITHRVDRQRLLLAVAAVAAECRLYCQSGA